MKFPQAGRSADDILTALRAQKSDDVPWEEGRVFAYIYDAGPEAKQLLMDAGLQDASKAPKLLDAMLEQQEMFAPEPSEEDPNDNSSPNQGPQNQNNPQE